MQNYSGTRLLTVNHRLPLRFFFWGEGRSVHRLSKSLPCISLHCNSSSPILRIRIWSILKAHLNNFNFCFNSIQQSWTDVGQMLEAKTKVVRISTWSQHSDCEGLETRNQTLPPRFTARCGEDLRQQWPEPGCWPAAFVKTMVCWGCSVSRAQKTWLWSLLFKVFMHVLQSRPQSSSLDKSSGEPWNKVSSHWLSWRTMKIEKRL